MGSKQLNWLPGGLGWGFILQPQHPNPHGFSAWLNPTLGLEEKHQQVALLTQQPAVDLEENLCAGAMFSLLLCALCKQIWQAGIVTLGSSPRVYSGCLIPATAILHFSELALNAGPEVTIYSRFCWLRISLKANNGYKSVPLPNCPTPRAWGCSCWLFPSPLS